MSLIFLLVAALLGFYVIRYFFPKNFAHEPLLTVAFSFLLGNFLAVWLVFLLAVVSSFVIGVWVGLSLMLVLTLIFYVYNRSFGFEPSTHTKKIEKADIVVLVLSLGVSWYIMTQTLSITSPSTFKIGADVFSDFELHIPLIRSFSWGDNIPPTSPFFPGKNLSYHFMFHIWAAALETLGLSVINAINTISIASLTCLLYLLFKFTQHIGVKNSIIAGIPPLLFLFNSSFGFLDAIRKLKPSSIPDFFSQIWNNTVYLSVGPFVEEDKVSIIWNLNAYVNQRHLLFTTAIAVILLYPLYEILKKQQPLKTYIFLGIIWGLIPFWQAHIFVGLGVIFGIALILAPKQRKYLLASIIIGVLIAFPQLYWLSKDIESTILLNPGFLSHKPLGIQSFSSYWFFNLGLSLFAIPLGFFGAKKEQKHLFLALLGIFILGNVFQLNKEMFNNHKLFNFWLTIANIYTALFCYTLYKNRLKKLFVIPLLIALTFSGILDFMVIKNQPTFMIDDAPKNAFADWVKNSTPPNSIFLLSRDEMYYPVRLAGRYTYQYQPRYAWAYGYNVEERDLIAKDLFAAENVTQTKNRINENAIRFVVLPKDQFANTIFINYDFFHTYPVVYQNDMMEVVQIQ